MIDRVFGRIEGCEAHDFGVLLVYELELKFRGTLNPEP